MDKPKVKIKEKKKDEDNFDFMKCNKDNINNVIKDDKILTIINDLVNRTNKIVIHSYQFIKLYFSYLYSVNIAFPLIDKEFICDVFKVITIRKCGSGGYTENNMPEQLKKLSVFYKEHYINTLCDNEIIYYDKLSYILAYEAIDMTTNINNNIQEHFIDHLNKYVHIIFNVKEKSNEITKNNKDKIIRKELHKQLYDEINKVKKDLITFGDMTSDIKYHDWIKEQKLKLFPNKNNFEKNSIHYDLKSNTQDYLISMFYILDKLEKLNDDIIKNNKINNTENKQIRLFNVLPLRTNIIGKNIMIDTAALISNFLCDEPTSKHLSNYKKDNNQFDLWNRFFKLNEKVFKKNKYTFHFMIRTDGVSLCILFIRLDKNNKPLKKSNKNNTEEINTDYIEKVEITNDIKNKKVICIDPGYSDIVFCGSKNKKGELETFRYTQNQRRLETRNKKYNKIIDKINKETKIIDKSIKEIETTISTLNSKTINYEKFKTYCIEKNKINNILYKHYEQKLFRKLKLNRFINTQKSESKMVKNFKNKFGETKDTIIVLGDYDKGDYNMKGKEPTILKKIRRIFKNGGYKTYLINEFKTSKLCNCCNNELEKFLERESHKPKLYKEKKKEIVHGLLRSQSIKQKCEIIHNRDKNAVQNMLNIVKSIFNTGKRPEAFCRVVNS